MSKCRERQNRYQAARYGVRKKKHFMGCLEQPFFYLRRIGARYLVFGIKILLSPVQMRIAAR